MIDVVRAIPSHLRAMPDVWKVAFAATIAYRAEMAIWILATTLPLVMLALWNTVLANGPIAGFDQAGIARYFAATLVVRQLTGAWVIWALNDEIRTGELSPKLLRPMNPLWSHALFSVTAVPFRMVILAPMLAGLVLWRPDLWITPSVAQLALFAFSSALAWALAFLAQAFFGLLAFWFDRSLGLWGVWFAVWTVLSGYVAPLALFPQAVGTVLRWSPFRAMLATPVEIVGGFVAPLDALPLVGAQVVWTTAFFGLVVLTWKAGVRRYGAFGA